jgi:hypothetical protein
VCQGDLRTSRERVLRLPVCVYRRARSPACSRCLHREPPRRMSRLTTGSSGPTIAFESIDGPPVGESQPPGRQPLQRGAVAQRRDRVARGRRQLSRARISRRAGHPRSHAIFPGVGRVRRREGARAGASAAEEAGGPRRRRPGGASRHEPMLREIARTSVDRLAPSSRNPDASRPGRIPRLRMSAEPEPQRKPQRRPRSAERPAPPNGWRSRLPAKSSSASRVTG